MKTTKICSGLYEVKVSDGRVFQVEDLYQARADGEGRGTWNVFQMNGDDRDYCQSYANKREAMASVACADRGEW